MAISFKSLQLFHTGMNIDTDKKHAHIYTGLKRRDKIYYRDIEAHKSTIS